MDKKEARKWVEDHRPILAMGLPVYVGLVMLLSNISWLFVVAMVGFPVLTVFGLLISFFVTDVVLD